jgi:hypothetical protein
VALVNRPNPAGETGRAGPPSWCGVGALSKRSTHAGQLRWHCHQLWIGHLYSVAVANRARGGCRECAGQPYEDEGAPSQSENGEVTAADREGGVQWQ